MLKKIPCVLLSLTLLAFSLPLFFADAEEGLSSGDFLYEVVTNETTGYSYLKLTGYTGHEKDLTLPTEIDGLPVECVWNLATSEGDCPERLVIPEGIKAVGMLFGQKNTALKEVILPSSLKVIGHSFHVGAFMYATSLTELVVPYTVSLISAIAFEDTTTLRGEKGSYVARWAEANQHPFDIITHDCTPGDFNADGKCNTVDARLALQYSARCIPLSEEQITAADVNGDGRVNTVDARLILRHAAALTNVSSITVPSNFESPLISIQQATEVTGHIYALAASGEPFEVVRPIGPLTNPNKMISYLNGQIRQEYHTQQSIEKTLFGAFVTAVVDGVPVYFSKTGDFEVNSVTYYGLSFTVDWNEQFGELIME